MENRLYVGNLSYNTSTEELRQEFEKCGAVTDAKVVTDRETGRSRGFGFVEFVTEAEAQTAIQALNGYIFGGRNISVRIAEKRQNRGGSNQSYSPRPAPVQMAEEPVDGGSDRGRGKKKHKGHRRNRDDAEYDY